MGTQWTTRQKIAINLKNRTNFRFGNISGEWWEYNPPKGRLPEEWAMQLNSDVKDKDVFVVFSYGTPIGWSFDQNWTIPDVSYSSTTTHHQSVLKVATMDNSPYLP